MGKKSRQKWLNRETKVINQENKKSKKKKVVRFSLFLLIFLVLVSVGIWQTLKYYNKGEVKKEDNEIAVIETSKGKIELKLFRSIAPKTVENFVKLANEGFYNGVTFHRVIEDFMIQTGDPLSKDDDPSNDGTGGPGYSFEDEINPWYLGLDDQTIKSLQDQGYNYNRKLESLSNTVGAVAMANSGPNTNGSQFFIITQSDQSYLDGKHTVFAKVISGMDVVRDIATVETDETDRPIEDVTINDIYITTIDLEEKISEDNGFTIETTGGDGTIKIDDVQVETE